MKALSGEQKKKAQEHAAKCIEKIGVSKDDVLKVMGGDFSVTDTKIEVRVTLHLSFKPTINGKIPTFAVFCQMLL